MGRSHHGQPLLAGRPASNDLRAARTGLGLPYPRGQQPKSVFDVLVANAGYGHDGLSEASSMDDLRGQFEVNVYGTVAVIKAVLRHMRERRSGHIIAVISMGGLITMPGLSFYYGSGRRPGDPDRAAAAVLRIVGAEQPPMRLLLGTDPLRLVRAGRDACERDMLAWVELSASTDFDDVSRSV